MLTREQIESQLGIKVKSILSSHSSKEFTYLFDFEKFGLLKIPPSALKSPKRFSSWLFTHLPFKLPYISEEIFDYLVSFWLTMIEFKKHSSPRFKYIKFLEEYLVSFLKESSVNIFKNKRIFKLKDFIVYLRIVKIIVPRWQIIYFLRRNGWEPHNNGSFRSWSKTL